MNTTTKPSKAVVWISYIMQGLITLSLVMGAAFNLSGSEEAVKGSADMGYPISVMPIFGITMLLCAILYVIPRTSILGLVLISGWIGGAVATHIIHHDSIGKIIFPAVYAVIAWGAIWLRNEQLRAVLPFSKKTS